MMFDKNSLIRLLYSVFVATIITSFALLVTTGHLEAVFYIVKGMCAGAVIWLLGEVLSSLCEKLFPQSVLPQYGVLVFLILLGTAGFGYLLGVTDIGVLVIMTIAAEVCGIGITMFYRSKYIHALNDKLAKSKDVL